MTIKLLRICTFFSLVGLLIACTDELYIDPENSFPQSDIESIIIDPINCISIIDEELTIEKALIEGDTLTIIITYGGGCGTIVDKLLTCGNFMESNPVQLDISLSHQDNDFCKALIRKEIKFDLSPLAQYYKSSYQTTNGIIIIRLQGLLQTLWYEF